MSDRETQIQRSIREAVNAMPGVRFWRNNVGAYQTAGGFVRFGLAPGSADLIGMVDGRFCAIEVKTPRGRMRPDQVLWRDAVLRLGGRYATCRSVEEALAFVALVRSYHVG